MRTFAHLSVLSLSLLINACNKKETGSGFNYAVHNIQDVIIKKGESTVIPIEIKHMKGTQKEVSLTITGIPNNVLFQFSRETDIPSFSTSLKLTATLHCIPGKYPLNIVTSVPEETSRTYPMMLEIIDAQ